MLDSVFFPHFFYFIRELNLYTPLVTIFHIQNRYHLLQTHPSTSSTGTGRDVLILEDECFEKLVIFLICECTDA